MVKKISQHVDTLKFHYYIDNEISDDSFFKYIGVIDSLLVQKKEAQTLKNEYGDIKSVNIQFDDMKFNVQSQSITGFSVLLLNNDISIALRKTKSKINPSPMMKIEFRAEFLARYGYMKCIKLVNDFVSKHLLDSYKIKVSEIHLATDIQGYNFTHLDFFKMKTRSRKTQTHEEETDYSRGSAYGGLNTFTGFTFGGGDYHLRIYNKTVEINKLKNKGFALPLLWEHKSNFNPDGTVWRIEIQIRRAKLKKMVNLEGSTLDNYENVLNSIPSLWAKALSDYTIKDISDLDCFNMLRGYKFLKNGSQRIMTKNSIYGIFKRADDLNFWDDLKIWNSYIGTPINTAFKIPTVGSFDYVSNSIKSLYSTMAKHYGSVSTENLIDAFRTANEINIEKKEIGLLEDTFNKQLDWFERIDFLVDNGVCNLPDYKHLEHNIFTTVQKSNELLHDISYSDDFITRLESRRAFPSFSRSFS